MVLMVSMFLGMVLSLMIAGIINLYGCVWRLADRGDSKDEQKPKEK